MAWGNEQPPVNPSGKWEFILKKGVRDFGLPLGLVGSAWPQIRNLEPGTPIGALIFGTIIGAVAGAIVGGGIFGWIMWSFFGRRDTDGR